MKTFSLRLVGIFALVLASSALGTVRFVDLNCRAPSSPYTDWTSAATNIQDAIDISSAGDVIWVTNGVYATGGKGSAGGLTNRVLINKALTVQSVNGPAVTWIQGARDPAGNGLAAVRCASVTNGAVLVGFTLSGGGTLANSGTFNTQECGGGVAGSSNALVLNCVITNNAASWGGGGAFGLSLSNCSVLNNQAGSISSSLQSSGGGASSCRLTNCFIIGNSAVSSGSSFGGGTAGGRMSACFISRNSARFAGGAYGGTLVNCTVTGNQAISGAFPGYGGGVDSCLLTNCIVYSNQILNSSMYDSTNYDSSTLSFCCAAPLAPGPGNIAVEPELLADGYHLTTNSPCRGAGTNSVTTGLDIDGQAWANPPSIGGDEWRPQAVIGGQPQAVANGIPLTLKLTGLGVAGQGDFNLNWYKDGNLLADGPHYVSTHAAELITTGFGADDAGTYQLVAGNDFNMATSAVVRVVVHCASANGTGPVPPYSTWLTAATNLQDLVDATSVGEFGLVTNGVYATGGRVESGDLTNRVALDKPIGLFSVSGPASTIIEGAWDPMTTNGPGAVRCVWLTNGATLYGFTLRHGATRNLGDVATLQSGGGAYCVSTTNGYVVNCVVCGNAAVNGGGCYQGFLRNSLIVSNVAAGSGGGVYNSMLANCTLTGNFAPSGGGMAASSTYLMPVLNSIVYGNSSTFYSSGNDWQADSYGIAFFNSCTPTPPYWQGSTASNITASPQSLDGVHLTSTSPCRGAGRAAYAVGTDIDGDPFTNPPSMGCDEYCESSIAGPLSVGALRGPGQEAVELISSWVAGSVSGRATRLTWSFGDGSILTNASYLNAWHTWTNVGDYTVTFTAYNFDHPEGVSTNLAVHVVPVIQPALVPGVLQSNAFALNVPAQDGVTYSVIRATNLIPPIVWQYIGIISGHGTNQQFRDSGATNPMQFYRLQVLQ